MKLMQKLIYLPFYYLGYICAAIVNFRERNK